MIIILPQHMLVCCAPDIEAECKNKYPNIAKWSIEKMFYGDEGLLMHEKIWDILSFDKEGRPREHSCGRWYVRIAGHRIHSVATNSAATEHANDADPFRKLAEDIFAHDS